MRVQTGDNVLIGGFILVGSAPKKVILRAIGPSLTADNQALPGRLPDPTLTLFDNAGPLFTNDDWMNSSQKQQIIDSTISPTSVSLVPSSNITECSPLESRKFL